MPAFFSTQRGMVARVGGAPTPGVRPFRISIPALTISNGENQQAQSIITSARLSEQGSYKFTPTLDETIYATIFGDKMGSVQISGVCFAHTCWGGGADGMADVINSYRLNRMRARSSPVMVSFGATPLRGLLGGLDISVADGETMLGQWTLTLHTFPGDTL